MSGRRDRGAVLPLVLVVVVVLGVVVVAVAEYASSTLRYGQTVEYSADRLASANGAMDNILESIDRETSPCVLTTLANGGYQYDLLDASATVSDINGINPTLRCDNLGAPITGIEEFALIITGDPGTGARGGEMLNVSGSSTPRKVIDGPVYMGDRPRQGISIDIAAPLTIQNGDLLYSRSSCPATDVAVTMFPAGSGNQNLLITPAGYQISCLESPNWETLFQSARPSEAAVPTSPLNPSPTVDANGCTVWEPGRYTTAPTLGSYNYFRSGNYNFENLGVWSVTNAYALFGYPGAAGPGIPGYGNDTLTSNVCVDAWTNNDTDGGGATLYLGGNTRIAIGNNGALEVSGRNQSGQFVAVQALEVSGVPSTIQGDTPLGFPSIARLIEVGPGTRKQLSFSGLLWAPYGSMDFRNVSNDAVAALTGGGVVGEIFLQAPASASNFLIGSGGTAGTRTLQLTASASTPDGGTTLVRSVIDYRDGDYALLSRRVMCLTPGEPDPSSC